MKIIKRSGAEAIFDANKIAQAVKKANDSVVAVSYTHLDVYKRQLSAPAASPACSVNGTSSFDASANSSL